MNANNFLFQNSSDLKMLLAKTSMLILAAVLFMPFASVSAQSTDSSSGPLVSENWSGYTAENGSTYNAVGGTWNVPYSNGPSSSGEATWIGIGGFQREDLLQVGTLTLINTQGQPSYYGWYELLPADPVTMPVEVHPGDSISASIVPLSSGSNQWLIFFTNNTTGKSYQTAVTYNSSRVSAEWVEEVPTRASNGAYLPLSNFGTVNFTNVWTVQDNATRTAGLANASPMYMLDFNTNLAYAAPSVLTNNGSTFTVTRTTNTSERQSTPTETVGKWYRVTVTYH